MLAGPSDSSIQGNNVGGMSNDLMGLFDAPPQNNNSNPMGQGVDLFGGVGDMFGQGA